MVKMERKVGPYIHMVATGVMVIMILIILICLLGDYLESITLWKGTLDMAGLDCEAVIL